ncbi:DUF4828 domain-containing protein [Lacticaseibacillus camelliae]|uniref:DUF4828 domain-containing protein n=2 Tax=Lacticaseibacillus camelliae TaxID=381742 RepID=UPI000A94A79A|nr:DUF4828 domain-containing protein [Lacticaseibacillus camelliae]
MPSFVHNLIKGLKNSVPHRHHRHGNPAPTPMETLAQQYTGRYAFLDELTNKTHQIVVSKDLAIKIDGRVLPGTVTGISTDRLTFLDHYGYQLIITNGESGPTKVYDEAEDTTYNIIAPTTPTDES